jgi:hypothetical protein
MSDGSLTRDARSIVATETLLKLVTNAVFPSGVTATPNARLLTYTERVVANLEKLGLLANAAEILTRRVQGGQVRP